MKRFSLFVMLVWLGNVGGDAASAQEAAAGVEPEHSDSAETEEACFPACRSGYICHPQKKECVSICNPPCGAWEVCTEEAECAPQESAPAKEHAQPGDRRFRFVLLGRFGLGGKVKVNFTNPLSMEEGVLEAKPGATLGFDLRFEKPVAKYVSVGGLVSNYWLRSQRDRYDTSGLRFSNRNDYALDIAPFVKPRYPFNAGSKEAEAYVVIHVGGSLRLMEIYDGVFLDPKTGVYGGFNWGIAPGFQIFVTRHMGLVFEVGYAKSWFKIGSSFLQSTRVGQATLRFGFTFAF